MDLNNIRAGSAVTLFGKVYVLSIFISEDGKWGAEAKNQAYQKLYQAQNWLTLQAKRYGISNLSFENGNFGLEKDIIVSPISTDIKKVDWTYSVLTNVGYTSPLQFYDWFLKNKSHCSSCICLIFANKNGRSFAVPFKPDVDKKKYFVEGAMIFQNYDSGNETAAATIAHEILHLYGAFDLYQHPSARTNDVEAYAKKLFPNDIMLRVSYNINELVVDKLTAYLVGFSQESESWFDYFRPNYL